MPTETPEDQTAAYPPNYPDSHDPTGPPSTEELLGKSSAASVTSASWETVTCPECGSENAHEDADGSLSCWCDEETE